MNMRERMAWAMFSVSDTYAIGHTWETISEQHRLDYLEEADAALDALITPTIEMYSAGGDEFHKKQALDPMPRAFGSPDHAYSIWRAMIQAAKDGK